MKKTPFSIFSSFHSAAGFTLMELLVYVSAVTLIGVALISFGLIAIRTGAKIKAEAAVLANTRRALEVMTYEIKKSRGLYTPTSVFNSDTSQLSLEQTLTGTPGETTTFVDFFRCGEYLCLKREGQDPLPLTNDQVKVTRLVFSQILNSTAAPGIRLQVRLESTSNFPVSPASFLEVTTAVNLRGY